MAHHIRRDIRDAAHTDNAKELQSSIFESNIAHAVNVARMTVWCGGYSYMQINRELPKVLRSIAENESYLREDSDLVMTIRSGSPTCASLLKKKIIENLNKTIWANESCMPLPERTHALPNILIGIADTKRCVLTFGTTKPLHSKHLVNPNPTKLSPVLKDTARR